MYDFRAEIAGSVGTATSLWAGLIPGKNKDDFLLQPSEPALGFAYREIFVGIRGLGIETNCSSVFKAEVKKEWS
jgi:hypothetical protein